MNRYLLSTYLNGFFGRPLIRFNFENQENHLKYTMEYSHLIVDEDLGKLTHRQTVQTSKNFVPFRLI